MKIDCNHSRRWPCRENAMDKPTASIASLSQYQDRLAAFLLQRGEYAGDEAALNIYRNNVMISLLGAMCSADCP